MKSAFHRVVYFPAVIALLLDAGALVDFLLHPLAVDHSFYSSFYRAATILIPLPLTLLVGFLIIRRVPGNVVGPLMFVWSGTIAYNSIRLDLPPEIFGLFYGYNTLFGWLGLFLIILHFPDGKVYPSRAASWIYPLIGLTMVAGGLAFLTQPVFALPSQQANPYFIAPLAGTAGFVNSYGVLSIAPLLLLDLISPVLRYRRGSLLAQQQIKWLALCGGSTAIYTLLGLIIYPLLTGGQVMEPGSSLFAMFFFFITGLFPALAIGVAVLRYRLWDIDRIIRRTLVYSLMTVILSLIYLGSVLVLQTTFAFFFKLGSNDLAIVLSTLGIAAIFSPLRRRVQSAIDRRFFRRRYDADQILASFASTARGVVTLEPLAAALLGTIEETLQPDQMGLWIKSRQENK